MICRIYHHIINLCSQVKTEIIIGSIITECNTNTYFVTNYYLQVKQWKMRRVLIMKFKTDSNFLSYDLGLWSGEILLRKAAFIVK